MKIEYREIDRIKNVPLFAGDVPPRGPGGGDLVIRKAYLDRILDRLESVEREIGILSARGKKAREDLRPRFEEEIEALGGRMESARDAIRRIREADAARWGPLKGAAEKAVEELRRAVSEAAARLRKSA